MTGPVTPAAIAEVVKRNGTTLQEAANLIQAYADQYAEVQLARAMRDFAARQLASLEAPVRLS